LLRLDSGGALTVVAGGPDYFSGDGGPAAMATLASPQAIAVDAAGNVYIGDSGNHRVRKVTRDGVIQTIAGAGPGPDTLFCGPPTDGVYLQSVSGLALDQAGNLYISDAGANRVWKMDLDGQLSAFAGNGQAAFGQPGKGPVVGVVASTISIDFPGSVAADRAGNVWVTSLNNGLVKISAAGTILNVLADIQHDVPVKSVGSDPAGNVYVATGDRAYRIRAGVAGQHDQLVPLAAPGGTMSTLEGPSVPQGTSYPVGISPYAGPGGLAAFADNAGTLYYLTPASIQVIPRSCATRSISTAALTAFARGAADPAGGIYLVDSYGSRIWRLESEPASSGPPAPVLGPAAVRNLASGIVEKFQAWFKYGDFGAVGIGEYDFVSDAIAPGELIRISGTCLGPFDPVEVKLDAPGGLPMSLAATQVTFDGISAPLMSVGSGEIVAVAPYAVAGRSQTQMTVTNGSGQVSATVTVSPAAPGLFHEKDSTGADSVVAVNSDGSPNSAQSAAQVGSVIALYATGLGQTDPPSVDGVIRAGDRQVTAAMSVKVNGVDAPVVYAGPVPGFVGAEQINIRVPATASGVVTVTAAGVSRSQNTVLWIAK
jgi:uncharacterized protein (TIGR03437 family)